MRATRPALGRAVLTAHHMSQRIRGKAFSWLAGPGFAAFGRGSVVEPPVRLGGADRIWIGEDVYVGGGSWLQVLGDGELIVGDGCKLAGHVVLSAALRLELGARVLIARGVYVADHAHAFSDPTTAVMDQGIDDLAPVRIGDGAWLGAHVVVCPGVTIGPRAVVGANSVVTRDVPAGALAVGAPARVVRTAPAVKAA